MASAVRVLLFSIKFKKIVQANDGKHCKVKEEHFLGIITYYRGRHRREVQIL
jgi:hypothetical protein